METFFLIFKSTIFSGLSSARSFRAQAPSQEMIDNPETNNGERRSLSERLSGLRKFYIVLVRVDQSQPSELREQDV